MVETFLLVLAAIFSVVNPPGAALVFLSMTQHASIDARRSLARRIALNAFFVMAGSLLVGAFILKIYGISVPVLRVAGGLIVAHAGWTLLNAGNQKSADEPPAGQKTDYESQVFYPLTLPLTTGPGTIAVMISLGLSQSAAHSGYTLDFRFVAASFACDDRDGGDHLCLLCLFGPGRAVAGARRHRYRRAALGLHSFLSGRADHLDRSERSARQRARADLSLIRYKSYPVQETPPPWERRSFFAWVNRRSANGRTALRSADPPLASRLESYDEAFVFAVL